jgi:hypothetical protein
MTATAAALDRHRHRGLEDHEHGRSGRDPEPTSHLNSPGSAVTTADPAITITPTANVAFRFAMPSPPRWDGGKEAKNLDGPACGRNIGP